MALDNFTWFDRKPDYSNNQYTPSKQGFITTLGRTLSGIGAAFAGDTDYAIKQARIDQEKEQADMEFRAKLLQQKLMENDNINQKELIDRITKQGYIPKPYITADGKTGVSFVQDPEIQAQRTIEIAAQKKLDANLPSIASTLKSIEDAEKYAGKLPKTSTGLLNQTFAKGEAALGKYSADKRYTDFDAALSKLKTQSARSVMQEIGNLAQTEQENALNTIGKAELPLDNKLSNLNNLRSSLLSGMQSLLQSANKDMSYLEDKHPEIYKRLNISSDNKIPNYDPSKQKLQKNKKTGEYRVVSL